MSLDEEFVRARHPNADLVENSDPGPDQYRWCVHYGQDVGSLIIGQGNTAEEAWASAREKCKADAPVD